MRYLKYLVLLAIAIVLIFVALANRQMVELNLVPSAFQGLIPFNFSLSVPLFVVIFGGVVGGVLVGFVWEWVREHKHRSAVRKEHKQVVRLEREVGRLKANQNEGKDDILALIKD